MWDCTLVLGGTGGEHRGGVLERRRRARTGDRDTLERERDAERSRCSGAGERATGDLEAALRVRERSRRGDRLTERFGSLAGDPSSTDAIESELGEDVYSQTIWFVKNSTQIFSIWGEI